MEKPVEWVWYGRDNDGESHISLGRWKRHSCQMRYKLAEIQPTEHDRADLATIDPAAIREAALKEAAEIALSFHQKAMEWAKTVRGLAQHIDETDSLRISNTILALIGEANSMIGEKK